VDIEGAAERGQPAGAVPGARGVKPGPVVGDGEPEAPAGAREATVVRDAPAYLAMFCSAWGRRRLSLWGLGAGYVADRDWRAAWPIASTCDRAGNADDEVPQQPRRELLFCLVRQDQLGARAGVGVHHELAPWCEARTFAVGLALIAARRAAG
jgi:hypothetical protein